MKNVVYVHIFVGERKKAKHKNGKDENKGGKETFKNSCVIYRRKMTLAFACCPLETVQYFEPGAKNKALQQLLLGGFLYLPLLLDGTI